jgi:hypothetical protein
MLKSHSKERTKTVVAAVAFIGACAVAGHVAGAKAGIDRVLPGQKQPYSACTDQCKRDYQACGNTTACQNAYWNCLSQC